MQQNLCHTNLAPPKFDTRPPTAYNSGFSKSPYIPYTILFRRPLSSEFHSFPIQLSKIMHVSELQPYTFPNSWKWQKEHGIENANRFRKQDLVFAIVRQMMKQGEKLHLFRHARNPARRLRLFTQRRHLLPRRSRRHLRLTHANPPLQPAYGRHHRR